VGRFVANILTIAKVKETFSFVLSLLGFNIGVEIGQIFVVLISASLLYDNQNSIYTQNPQKAFTSNNFNLSILDNTKKL